jgi:hypothetical protein
LLAGVVLVVAGFTLGTVFDKRDRGVHKERQAPLSFSPLSFSPPPLSGATVDRALWVSIERETR